MADVRVQIPLGALCDRAQQQELTNFLVKHRRTTPVTGSNPVTRLLGLAWSPIIEVWERWVNPPVWETGERWFESSHLDCELIREWPETGAGLVRNQEDAGASPVSLTDDSG